jgi:hypothetical protein
MQPPIRVAFGACPKVRASATAAAAACVNTRPGRRPHDSDQAMPYGRSQRPTISRNLGEPARPDSRRRPRILPETARRRGECGAGPSMGPAMEATSCSAAPCPTYSGQPFGTSRALRTRFQSPDTSFCVDGSSRAIWAAPPTDRCWPRVAFACYRPVSVTRPTQLTVRFAAIPAVGLGYAAGKSRAKSRQMGRSEKTLQT